MEYNNQSLITDSCLIKSQHNEVNSLFWGLISRTVLVVKICIQPGSFVYHIEQSIKNFPAM